MFVITGNIMKCPVLCIHSFIHMWVYTVKANSCSHLKNYNPNRKLCLYYNLFLLPQCIMYCGVTIKGLQYAWFCNLLCFNCKNIICLIPDHTKKGVEHKLRFDGCFFWEKWRYPFCMFLKTVFCGIQYGMNCIIWRNMVRDTYLSVVISKYS